LEDVATIVRERAPAAVLHTDAAPALTWLDLRDAAAPADLITLASHKCGGPVGIGALVVRGGVSLSPQQIGGGQERERRSGTQDVVSAVAFAAAAESASEQRAELVARAGPWRDALVGAAMAVPGTTESVVPSKATRDHLVAGIANLCLPAVESEALLFVLEHDHRILASAASSCASGAQEPSHVLAAIGIDRPLAAGSLRLSLGWSTTQADVDAATDALPRVISRLQAHARDGAPA
jgi:cysteine desulfurase